MFADDEYIFAGGDYIFALGEQRKKYYELQLKELAYGRIYHVSDE